MSQTASLALVLIVAGCSPAPTESLGPRSFDPITGGDIRVVNATTIPFAFFAIASDLMPLLYPVPEMPLKSPHIQLVSPGSERALGEIPGWAEAPKGGVAVYLYAITADGERVRFSDVQLTSGARIRQAGGRIVVRQVPPPS